MFSKFSLVCALPGVYFIKISGQFCQHLLERKRGQNTMNLKIHCQKVLMSCKPKSQYSNLLNRWASPAIMNCWVLVQFLFPNIVKKEKTQCDAALCTNPRSKNYCKVENSYCNCHAITNSKFYRSQLKNSKFYRSKIKKDIRSNKILQNIVACFSQTNFKNFYG